MRIINLLFASLFLFEVGKAQTSATVTDLNNNSKIVSSLSGKKIMIIFLPSVEDTSLNNQLVRFEHKYADSVGVIALACLSNCQLNSSSLLTWYSDAITAGVFITEGSALANDNDQREAIIKWLSARNKNDRQSEPSIVGSKYFLSKQGKLYAQLGTHTSLDLKVVDHIVQTKVPGEY